MQPDDPRHGTSAGHNAGCKCEPCRQAKLKYDKQRSLDLLSGRTRTVPAWRVRRRIEALQALGWGLRAIAAEAGIPHNHIYRAGRKTAYASTFARIDMAYERMSMRVPNPQTQGEKSGYARTTNFARRLGFVPPLGWNDIDDPNEQPIVLHKDQKINDAVCTVDHIVVARILGGDRVPATDANRAERCEVVRRWPATGRPINDLARLTGWKPERYGATA